LHLKRVICVGAVAAGALASTVGVASASAATISEAGSSLVYPVASVWASHYTGATVNTAAGGSGKGIQLVTAGQVDIGASDAPMTSSQYGSGSYVQIPWGLSATGIGYNLPGVKSLDLTGKLLAGIYTGQITSWGSSAITSINKKYASALKRDGNIVPVFRSDGSGDSYAIQHYMSLAAPSVWKDGFGTIFTGPSDGTGENGNSGVAGEVKSNKGTIGYISGAYLLQQHLSVASVANAAGNYEVPNLSAIADAAESNSTISPQGPDFQGISIVDPSSKYKTAYPISTYTYAIVSKSDSNLSAVQAFLSWVTSGPGLQYGASLDFEKLPKGVQSADAGLISSL
jgi:phosphate transport system substrate-binding protein